MGQSVRALERGVKLLQALTELGSATPHQLACATGVPRPTVYRLLLTLETSGLVVRRLSDDRFQLAIGARMIGDGYRHTDWAIEMAAPIVAALSREIVWPCDIATLDHDALVVRETTHASSPLSVDRGILGRRVPLLHSAMGAAYLAFCPDREREDILALLARSDDPINATARHRTTVDRLIQNTRAQGFGARVGGAWPHSACVALPVTWNDQVLCVVNLVWIASALTLSEVKARYLTRLKDAVGAIESALARTTRDGPARVKPQHLDRLSA
jgi:IclR family mhp operon transcriptional activator